jgi:NAD(P)-dependent dehydrogenase (short-subunit alcohol dehydrogenase family)
VNAFARRLALAGGLGAGALGAARAWRRKSRWFSYAGKTAIVTGGARGLGLVLARHLVDAGARVAICARTEADLRAAERELRARGGEVLSIRCDVRDREQVEQMVEQVLGQWGTVDLLFNVAGVIEVGPLDAMTREDFQRAMDTHCWGPLNTVLAVLSTMRRKRWGRIVNVSSIGGKQAVPHLLPYVASKFALVGLSGGLRTELAKDGIWVTTICPSLMRTGSPRNAIFKGQHRKEYAWFSIGDALPYVSMAPEEAAEQILAACQNGDGEVIVANRGNLGIQLQKWAPRLTQEIVTLVDRVLPRMGGIGQRAARGYESESRLSPSWLTQLGEEAAQRNNEMRRHPLDGR